MDVDATLAARLRRFGAVEATEAPLYRRLAPLAAERPALLALLRERQPGQPPANVLFGALQRRLMDRPDAVLRAYYPTLGGTREPDDDLDAAFDGFCSEELSNLRPLIRTRRVATNEVARAAVLRLAFVRIGRQLAVSGTAPRAHLVEVGASAGLTLLWDRFGYAYGPHRLGADPAPLVLATRWRRPEPPDPHPPFAVASRLGVDLDPPDLTDPEDVAWLRALIWPERVDRANRLDKAVALAREDLPQVTKACALAFLPGGLDALESELPAVVVHAFTLNQFSDAMRRSFEAGLADAAAHRPIYKVGFEWTPEGAALTLATYPPGRRTTIARADPHGAWIEPFA